MPDIQKLVLELLSSDYGKTAAHLVTELRVEYFSFYQELIVHYKEEYNLSGCGARMSPLTVVNQTLTALYKVGLVEKITENSATLWQKKR